MTREEELRDIEATLRERHDIRQLLEVILSFPEEKQHEAIQIALNYIEGRKTA